MTRLVSRGETPKAARAGEDDGLLVSIKEGGGGREKRERGAASAISWVRNHCIYGSELGRDKGSTKPAKMTWPFMSNAMKSRGRPS
jgi:hypothetical protein